jgi:hypothetical protein
MAVSEIHLLALLIIFVEPWLVWRLLRTDYWAPLVVVQIIAGILLGPGVLRAAFPDYYAFVFQPEVIGAALLLLITIMSTMLKTPMATPLAYKLQQWMNAKA